MSETKRIIPKKTPVPELPASRRRGNFREVCLGYTEELAVREAGRCLDCKEPACVKGCPVSVPVAAFVRAIRERDFEKAIATIKKRNLLPAVCGRVCPQENHCEKHCRLAKRFEPVAIGLLERFVADRQIQNRNGRPRIPESAPPTGKRVAVIGSGPSGLACAYDLARWGHEVTVFEGLHKPGGVLYYGIPEFRLPKSILAREIEDLQMMGVRILTNSVVGRLFTVGELMRDFDACFIGTGAGLPRFMDIEGEDLNGVYSANEFLTRSNLMRAHKFPSFDTPLKVGKSVVVVGGGNVAVDSARTALRIGAAEVALVYRRSASELPARLEEIRHAEQEGVRFEFCVAPVRILGEGGHVRRVECVRMDLCEPDETQRRTPRPQKGSEFMMPADTVIVAIGTGANPLVPRTTRGLALNERGYIVADALTGRTSIKGVFAGGDIVTGSATVISAMGAGRKAASAINQYLGK